MQKSGDELEMWLKSTTPEAQVPSAWLASDDGKKGGASSTSLQTLLMIQALRPDRVPAAATQYVKSVLGDNLLSSSEQELDLPAIVEDEIKVNRFIRFVLNSFAICPYVFLPTLHMNRTKIAGLPFWWYHSKGSEFMKRAIFKLSSS